MSARISVAFVAVCVVSLTGAAAGQDASGSVARSNPARSSRRLGIQGHFEYGYGLVVERVRWGSPAGRLGLERGDVIRAVDNRWLRTEADLRRQLRDADATAQLTVRDVRTGRLLRRPVQVR